LEIDFFHAVLHNSAAIVRRFPEAIRGESSKDLNRWDDLEMLPF